LPGLLGWVRTDTGVFTPRARTLSVISCMASGVNSCAAGRVFLDVGKGMSNGLPVELRRPGRGRGSGLFFQCGKVECHLLNLHD
jgi:hypothetical protein